MVTQFVAGQKLRAADMNSLIASPDLRVDAEYNSASNQTIPNGANTVLAFGTQNAASTLVTRSTDGIGHRFTFNRAGLWIVVTTLRWIASLGGERYMALGSNVGSSLGSQNDILRSDLSGPVTTNMVVMHYFAINDWVRVEVFQNSGGSRDLESSNSSGWGRINLGWIHA